LWWSPSVFAGVLWYVNGFAQRGLSCFPLTGLSSRVRICIFHQICSLHS